MSAFGRGKPDRIRWGILSTARINKALIGPLKKSSRSELLAVASRSPKNAQSFAKKNKIPKAYGSYRDLLADPEIDAVYISLPNHLHCEWSIAAAAAGKHVLCEKPLVLTEEEMDRVEAAAQTNSVTIFEAFMYLHHPQTAHLLKTARSGKLGQLQTIRSHFGYHLAPDSKNVRLRPEMGGGSLWDVGVYPVSFSVLMADSGLPIQVFGARQVGETGIDIGFEGLLQFSNDIVAQISCGFRRPLEWGATLVGSDGVVRIDEPWKPGFEETVSSVEIRTRKGKRKSRTFSAPDPYACEVEAMEACILKGAAPVVPLSLSRQIQRTVLALYQSAASGKAVRLDPS